MVRPNANASGAGAGKASFGSFAITKEVDKSTPALMQACASGKSFKFIQLDLARQASESSQDYLQLKFENCLVSSMKLDGVAQPNRLSAELSDALPLEEVGFSYAKITMTYRQMGADGQLLDPITNGWDLKLNRAIAAPLG